MQKIEFFIMILILGCVLTLGVQTVNACSTVKGNVVRILQK